MTAEAQWQISVPVALSDAISHLTDQTADEWKSFSTGTVGTTWTFCPDSGLHPIFPDAKDIGDNFTSAYKPERVAFRFIPQ